MTPELDNDILRGLDVLEALSLGLTPDDLSAQEALWMQAACDWIKALRARNRRTRFLEAWTGETDEDAHELALASFEVLGIGEHDP